MRYFYFFVLLAILLQGCTGTATVEKSTSQVWHGGAEGSGGGKHYVVSMNKPSKTIIKIEKVWIGERDKGWLPRFQVLPQPNDTADYHTAHAGITAFSVKFSETFPGEPMPRGNPQPRAVVPFDHPPLDLPPAFTHGAVIFYSIQGTQSTWIVEDFEELPVLNYP